MPDVGLLECSNVDAPSFPLEVLPEDVAKAVRILSTAKGARPDYLATALLTTVGGMLGDLYQVEIRPGWRANAHSTRCVVQNSSPAFPAPWVAHWP